MTPPAGPSPPPTGPRPPTGHRTPTESAASAAPDAAGPLDGLATGLRDRGVDPTVAAVVAVVVGSLLLRTVQLGARVFHWDEGRVGYWILRFDANGEFFYRPIIHGPFLPVVNNVLFDLIGASDFAARLPVAVVGGLLPLSALLLRRHLRDREVVALALLLSVDPLLVYYGRFMRGDVLVGSFCVAAFALVVYALDTRRTLPLFGAAALLGLGFTAKENALVYLACFLGAGFLLLDHRVVRTARTSGSLLDALVAEVVALGHFLDDWTEGSRTRATIERRVRDRRPDAPFASEAGYLGHLAVWLPVGAVGVAASFLAVTTFFYAPGRTCGRRSASRRRPRARPARRRRSGRSGTRRRGAPARSSGGRGRRAPTRDTRTCRTCGTSWRRSRTARASSSSSRSSASSSTATARPGAPARWSRSRRTGAGVARRLPRRDRHPGAVGRRPHRSRCRSRRRSASPASASRCSTPPATRTP
ncbi:flippase activity-associated protein Agl23 [Halobaculum litoreum]|uniref:Flippase activity-associated protein Agl23 n=1 Tax=Halobaculum litoreum TaxID=3031998 RepID=A0ABD5XVH0_9EURY